MLQNDSLGINKCLQIDVTDKYFNDTIISLLSVCEKHFNRVVTSPDFQIDNSDSLLDNILKTCSWSLFEIFNDTTNSKVKLLQNIYFVNKDSLFCKTGDFLLPILNTDYVSTHDETHTSPHNPPTLEQCAMYNGIFLDVESTLNDNEFMHFTTKSNNNNNNTTTDIKPDSMDTVSLGSTKK